MYVLVWVSVSVLVSVGVVEGELPRRKAYVKAAAVKGRRRRRRRKKRWVIDMVVGGGGVAVVMVVVMEMEMKRVGGWLCVCVYVCVYVKKSVGVTCQVLSWWWW